MKLRDPENGVTVEVITLTGTADNHDGQWFRIKNRLGVCLPPGTYGRVRSLPALEKVLRQYGTCLSKMEEV